MKLVVEITEDPGMQPRAVLERILLGEHEKVIQVQGFQATVIGEVKPEFEALVPYIVKEEK